MNHRFVLRFAAEIERLFSMARKFMSKSHRNILIYYWKRFFFWKVKSKRWEQSTTIEAMKITESSKVNNKITEVIIERLIISESIE